MARSLKQQEEEEKKERLEKTMHETMSKLSLSLDVQRVNQRQKFEAQRMRQLETKAKHEELTSRALEKREQLLLKINQDSFRAEAASR